MPQPADPREQRQATPDSLSDSILDGQQRAARFRQESEKRQAELAEQERRQRERQAAHERLAREAEEATRAELYLRVARMREEAKPPAEVPPVPVYTARQDEELAAEQAAGRRALEKYARRQGSD